MARLHISIRKAQVKDLTALLDLERRAFTELNLGRYPQELVERAAHEITMITPQLIAEGHFFVFVDNRDRIVACGGWSQEVPAHAADLDDAHSDIQSDTAVVRSMFVQPDMARRGLGRRMMELIELDAISHGVSRLTLSATRMGEPLYRACGFRPGQADVFILSDGSRIEGLAMEKTLAGDDCGTVGVRVAGGVA